MARIRSPKFEVFPTYKPDSSVEFNVRLRGGNGEIMWVNMQGYTSRKDAVRAIGDIKNATAEAKVRYVE